MQELHYSIEKKNGLQIATSIQDFTLEINSARAV